MKNTKFPLFSVIIPTYNRSHMLERAVLSVLNQTLESYEIIIVDDGSSIEHQNKIYNFSKTHKKIKFIKRERNQGVSVSRNIGIQSAAGKYISFLDDDDEYTPFFLKEVKELLEDDINQTDFCWNSVKYIDYSEEGAIEDEHRTRLFKSNYLNKEELFEELLSIGTGFGFTILSESIKNIGGFDETFKTVEDTDLFIRLIMKGCKAKILLEPNVIIHNHNQKRLTDNSMHTERISECWKLKEKYNVFFDSHPNLLNQLLGQIERLSIHLISLNSPINKDINLLCTS